jgi:hypothetical protein
MHAAGLDLSFETWESDVLPGFRLGLPKSEYDDPQTLTLAAREHHISGFAEKTFGVDLLDRTSRKLHGAIDGLLIMWALHELARRYHAQLSEQRDRWRLHDATTVVGATDSVKDAMVVMDKVANSRIIARDLLLVTEPDHWLQRDHLTFHRVVPALRKHYDDELHAALIAVLRREARTVDPLASDVEASTVTDSNLNVARSSLLLQQKVVSLTRWLVGFTIGLFVLTVVLGFLTYLALTKQG